MTMLHDSWRGFLLMGVLVLASATAPAEETTTSPAYTAAMNNFSHECTDCAAFFTVLAVCIAQRSDGKEVAANSLQMAEIMLQRARSIADEIGMLAATVDARLNMAMKDQMAAINKECINTSILLAKYLDRCKATFDNPTDAFQAHLESAMREYAD